MCTLEVVCGRDELEPAPPVCVIYPDAVRELEIVFVDLRRPSELLSYTALSCALCPRL